MLGPDYDNSPSCTEETGDCTTGVSTQLGGLEMGSQDIVNDEGVCEDVGGGHQQQARVEGYHDTGELDPPLSDEVWDNNVNGGVDQFEGDERVESHTLHY